VVGSFLPAPPASLDGSGFGQPVEPLLLIIAGLAIA
jgi:hypothetical protein